MTANRRLSADEFLQGPSLADGATLSGAELERAFWAYRGLALRLSRESAFWASINEALANTCEELARTSTELARRDRALARFPVVVQGESGGMAEALSLARAVAARCTTALLVGETGTGKGVLARYIHEHSPRAEGPFVELNCAGLHRELTEAELFGYERGAFTGARTRKLGLFEAADGGTLFLDEVGELDPSVQAQLLKVVDERRFRRLGGTTAIEVDTRLIAATHRDLAEDVASGRFRRDLLYRLNVFTIHLPALRDRPEDIVPLARRLLQQYSGGSARFSPEAEVMLCAYAWPGNVRELRNVAERAAILCPPEQPIRPVHLPPLIPCERPSDAAGSLLEEAERDVIERALETAGGNIVAAARTLGIARGTLYRKIRKYGLVGAEDVHVESEPPARAAGGKRATER